MANPGPLVWCATFTLALVATSCITQTVTLETRGEGVLATQGLNGGHEPCYVNGELIPHAEYYCIEEVLYLCWEGESILIGECRDGDQEAYFLGGGSHLSVSENRFNQIRATLQRDHPQVYQEWDSLRWPGEGGERTVGNKRYKYTHGLFVFTLVNEEQQQGPGPNA